MFSILLLIKNLSIALNFIGNASRINSSLKPTTFVSIGYRLGGESIIDKSCGHQRELQGSGYWRGGQCECIDVSGNRFNLSFTLTPNFCSSSTINKPKVFKTTFYWPIDGFNNDI
jgi:hypothetical protein